jgi:hypothetical protein
LRWPRNFGSYPRSSPTVANLRPRVPARLWNRLCRVGISTSGSFCQKRRFTRTSDLRLSGCRVVTIKPFRPGAKVRIRIAHKFATFVALGKVSYNTTHRMAEWGLPSRRSSQRISPFWRNGLSNCALIDKSATVLCLTKEPRWKTERDLPDGLKGYRDLAAWSKDSFHEP